MKKILLTKKNMKISGNKNNNILNKNMIDFNRTKYEYF